MEIVLSPLLPLLLSMTVGIQPPQPPPPATGSSEPPVQASEQGTATGAELPVDLDRIQRALSRPPAITTRTDRPVFRVEVLGRQPTIEEILGPDFLRGPVPHGGMTHQEFLAMVTPEEFRGYSMYTNGEALTIAATTLAMQWALMKAIDKLKEARTERAKEAARQEVAEAMKSLEAARARAANKDKRAP